MQYLVNPSILCKIPKAAIIAPRNPRSRYHRNSQHHDKSAEIGEGNRFSAMIMIAHGAATIFMVLPARWIVAQSGTVKIAIFSRTPFLTACASVTGIVAAED